MLKLLAYAKINPYLKIIGKRPDGFHELDLEFQSISLADELTFEKSESLELVCDPQVTKIPEDNLVYKIALALLDQNGDAQKPGALIKIKKNVPHGAGLGGGSADAAATLIGLNKLWELGLSTDELAAIGNRFGSDIAFCHSGGRARGIGRGEILTKLPDLPLQWLVLVKPSFAVSTPWAYQEYARLTSTNSIQKYSKNIRVRVNDLELAVIPAYPEIQTIKENLLALGASSALMSGSGSTVFGFVPDEETANNIIAQLKPKYWTAVCHTVETACKEIS